MKIKSYSETFPKHIDISENLNEYFYQWLITFQQEELKDTNGKINKKYLYDFACALCDDSPFGYEASHRIAAFIFGYFNGKKKKHSK